MRVWRISALLLGLFCSWTAAAAQRSAAQGAKQYGDPERGKILVGMWCAGCHTVPAAASDRAPPLASLAADPTRTDSAVRAFLMQPHKPMPPLEISTQQIEDIIAYMHALRPQPAQGR